MRSHAPLSSRSPSLPWPRRAHFRRLPNYLVAVLSELLALPLRLVARLLTGQPTDSSQWRKGLIFGPDHIGDILILTPSLPALQAGLPDCAWTFLVPAGSAAVLQGNPHLARLIIMESGISQGDWLRSHRAELRAEGYDVAITYGRGTSWRDLLVVLRLGIPNRVGFAYKGYSGLMTHPVPVRRLMRLPEYFRDLVREISICDAPPASDLRPLIYPTTEDVAHATAAWLKLGLEGEPRPILACAVTSRQPFGIWPPERFLESVLWVRERFSCPVVYLGAASDAPLLREIAERTGTDAHVLAGELDLCSLVCFLRRCRVALTPDSGTRHLAHAARIPVIFPRNLAAREEETGAFCPTDHDLAPLDLASLSPPDDPANFSRIDSAEVGRAVLALLQSSLPKTP